MSAIAITVKALLAGSGVTTLVGNAVYPIDAPQGARPEHIVVNLVGDDEEELLDGASRFPEGRVSIACMSRMPSTVDQIGQAVVDWLRDKHLYVVTVAAVSYEVTFRKEGTDVTDSSDQADGYYRRVVDFYVRRRIV